MVQKSPTASWPSSWSSGCSGWRCGRCVPSGTSESTRWRSGLSTPVSTSGGWSFPLGWSGTFFTRDAWIQTGLSSVRIAVLVTAITVVGGPKEKSSGFLFLGRTFTSPDLQPGTDALVPGDEKDFYVQQSVQLDLKFQ